MKNVAIILAGGSGSRLGADRPKQFLHVAGKTIMEHSIEAFHKNERIDEIAIVSKADFVMDVEKIAKRNGYAKVKHVLCGGKERYHSSLAALNAYTDSDVCLLIHDCVRPLVSQRIIDDCIDALQDFEAVDVAIPATDTIIELDDEGNIARIPQRKMLRNAQTPQCFRRDTLRKAFDMALKDPNFIPTDDATVVFTYLPEVPIKVVNGETTNIKVTYKEDLELAEKLLSTPSGIK